MAARKKKDPATVYRFTVDGASFDLDLDPDKMPIRERIEVEEYLGKPWAEAAIEGWLASNKALAILAFIAMRRRRPTVTLDDVLDSKELLIEEVGPEAKRPTKTPAKSGSQS